MSDVILILISLVLIALYYKKRIDNIEVLLIAFATQTFHSALGNTITAFFLIVNYLAFLELVYIYKNGIKIRVKYLPLIFLPFFSYIQLSLFWLLDLVEFEVRGGEHIKLALNPIIFYLKYFLPLLLVSHRLFRDQRITFNKVFTLIKKIAILSSYWAIIQFTVHAVLQLDWLDFIIGLKAKYHIGLISSFPFIRVNAFFYEPKGLGTFLVLAIPLLMKEKKYFHLFVLIIAGFLTMSNLFQLGIILCCISFILFGKVKNLVLNSAATFVSVVLIFITIQLIIVNIDAGIFKDNDVATFAIKRIKDRYNSSNPMSGNLVLGIPLQADLEGPVYNYIKDNPHLILSGYGPYYGVFIPDKYFKETYAYEARKMGVHKGHLDMGLLFFLFEFGLIAILYLLALIYSNMNTRIPFNKKYISFILSFMIFFRLEYIVVLLVNAKDQDG